MARLFSDPAILEECPGYSNPRVLLEHGVAVMVMCSRDADRRVAMHAAEWIVAYAQGLLAEQRERRREERAIETRVPAIDTRAQVIEELRGLYAKAALPAAEQPLVVEETAGKGDS
jgi:hypothetical protein